MFNNVQFQIYNLLQIGMRVWYEYGMYVETNVHDNEKPKPETGHMRPCCVPQEIVKAGGGKHYFFGHYG